MGKEENASSEEWREIEGYDKYLISNLGRVKSLKHDEGKILKAFPNNHGYLRVSLSKNGKSRHFLVSRLVASAFCENPDPSTRIVVDHIDGNTLNNNASNLQWLTVSENQKKEWRKYNAIRNTEQQKS